MGYKIITHNGKAHMDELLAISLLSYYLKELPEEIVRIHAEDAIKLAKNNESNQNEYFIDCGLIYSPEKKMFDHHQSYDLGCSALLIFETYFQDLIDTNLHEYVKLVSLVDTKGPNSLDDYKYKSESINYFSFPQKLLLREFENNPLLITSIFSNGIKNMIEFEKDKIIANTWLESDSNIKFLTVSNVNILIYNKPPPKELSSAIKAADGEIVDKKDIHAIYSYDKDNNEIRTLFRTLNADNLLDFCKSDVSNTIFCHKGGFLLKFIPKNENEWINIIKESIK